MGIQMTHVIPVSVWGLGLRVQRVEGLGFPCEAKVEMPHRQETP